MEEGAPARGFHGPIAMTLTVLGSAEDCSEG